MRRVIAVGCILLFSTIFVPEVAAQTEEGIKVHGHWKIEILEPDGTLVSVSEFDNALESPTALLLVLASDGAVGTMGVELGGPSGGTEPCGDGSGGEWRCFLAEPGANWARISDSTDLSITTPMFTLVLSGSVLAVNATTIAEVETTVKTCPPGVTPVACLYDGIFNSWGFTSTLLASPPSVASGQIIQVTVTISFS